MKKVIKTSALEPLVLPSLGCLFIFFFAFETILGL